MKVQTIEIKPSEIVAGDKIFAYGIIFKVKKVLERNDLEGEKYHPSGKVYCCISDAVENVNASGAFPQNWMNDFNLQGNDNRTFAKVLEA